MNMLNNKYQNLNKQLFLNDFHYLGKYMVGKINDKEKNKIFRFDRQSRFFQKQNSKYEIRMHENKTIWIHCKMLFNDATVLKSDLLNVTLHLIQKKSFTC